MIINLLHRSFRFGIYTSFLDAFMFQLSRNIFFSSVQHSILIELSNNSREIRAFLRFLLNSASNRVVKRFYCSERIALTDSFVFANCHERCSRWKIKRRLIFSFQQMMPNFTKASCFFP